MPYGNISRDISVDIETRIRAGRPMNQGSILGRGKQYFSSSQDKDGLWGPLFCCAMNAVGSFSGDKATGA
jgi:hypothetical protein